MIRRERITAIKTGLLGIFAALAAWNLPGTQGLNVVVTNSTASPLCDVEISHPNGTIVVPRIEPGATVARKIDRPLAEWGRSSEVPLGMTFTQEGVRSEPFTVRCEVGSARRGSVWRRRNRRSTDPSP